MTSLPWTPERVTALRDMHAAGLTASQIASRLGGTTRNAVLAKQWRLALTRTPAERAAAKGRHRISVVPPKAAPRRHVPEQSAPLQDHIVEEPATVHLLDAEPDQCRFIPGAGPQGMCCGKKTAPGLSYCPHHAQICYDAPRVQTTPTYVRRRAYA